MIRAAVRASHNETKERSGTMCQIHYSPHRIETTVPIHLGTVTWHRHVDWYGHVVMWTSWTTT